VDSLVYKLHQVSSNFGVLLVLQTRLNCTGQQWVVLLSAALVFAGWFHYHKAAPKLEWFQNVESMMNHHLAGLLGLGCLSWSGHQIHISLPVNKLLDAGVAP